MKRPFCPYCLEGKIYRSGGVLFCGSCFEEVRVEKFINDGSSDNW